VAKRDERELVFEASAYLQTLIGRELFRREDFAIVELIKNAYDSGASTVVITIRPPSEKEPGQITVLDDGSGMDLDTFRQSFMFAGYSERPEQAKTAVRVPTGEKGVGRFATDRLGTALSVTTKTKARQSALKVDIDWTRFSDRKKRFSDVTAPFTTVHSDRFHRGSGTYLEITHLRSRWERTDIERLRSSLSRLLNPFAPPKNFSLELHVPGSDKLSGPIEPPTIDEPDIDLRFELRRDGTVVRTVKRAPGLDEPTKEVVEHPFDTSPLVGMRGRLLYFLKRPSKTKVAGLPPAVRVYRDGFRIEPFGREDADWLGIEAQRAKRAGHAHVVPSRLFGFVETQRKKHPDLRDVTSREALLDNDASRVLVSAVRREIDKLEGLIKVEVTEPRWKVGQAERAAELERARLQTLSIMSFGLAHELRQPLQAIESEADNIKMRLRALDIDDAEITDSEKSIEANVKRIDGNIKLIASISSGNLEGVTSLDLADLLRRDCAVFAARAAAQGIDFQQDVPPTQVARVNAPTIGIVLANLINNSIDALRDRDGDDARPKRIMVSLSTRGTEHVIEVSDTGSGIPKEIQAKIFKKFATKKTGGMGVGLYHCNVIVGSQGGAMTFSTRLNVGTTFTVRFPEPKGAA
jgi:signal transduction histidine kinase